MRICLLGDCHFGIRGDSKSFHEYFEKFYSNVFFPTLDDRGVRTIIQLGDIFDRRKFVNFFTLAESRRYFFDECAKRNIQLHVLIGNHDIFWRESLDVNSPELLLKDYDNIRLWKTPGTLELDGIKFDMIPWMCKENEKEIFEFVQNSSSPICLGHFELSGFQLMRGVESHEGIDCKFLSNYNHVYSGHFHTRSQNENITYIGTPYELFWSDYKDPKVFGIIDTESLKIDYVQNLHRMFFKINYDDANLHTEDILKIEYERYANSYVKVVVLNKQNPYLFDRLMDSLYKANPIDVTIVEDFTASLEENDDEIVNQAEDTLTVLSKYIDTQTLNISDTNKLKTLMRELYVEALSQENTE